MASEITADGRVIPPLNITHPRPSLSLGGFHWDAVDEPNHEAQLGQETHDDNPTGKGVDLKRSLHRAPAVPSPLTSQESTLPDQLAGQSSLSELSAASPPLPFPLGQFQGSFAGNGQVLPCALVPFERGSDAESASTMAAGPSNMPNMPITNRGRQPVNPQDGPGDNTLELNLTTEQLTFGPLIGDIPNRGLDQQPDITLGGVPYLQTIQNVTNENSGKGDNPTPKGIHFEPGVWLHVPAANFQEADSVVRMASIPHGTTINAQALIPTRVSSTALGGTAGAPSINEVDSTPFIKGDPSKRIAFASMDATKENSFRIPRNLQPFESNGTINTDIIKNPNQILETAIKGQTIRENITFEVRTGPPDAKLNGGGTANISFLAGKQDPITNAAPSDTDHPNAHADFMTARFWIEVVEYQLNLPKLAGKATVQLMPTMPSGSTAPTPVFEITAPPAGVPATKTITVSGVQIQYSQIVNLNFAGLTWPHISVATLVPTSPQVFKMK